MKKSIHYEIYTKRYKRPTQSKVHQCGQTATNNSPSQVIASLTSNGYFISPSTKPGVSTNVTSENFFCFEVEISVVRKSQTPEEKKQKQK